MSSKQKAKKFNKKHRFLSIYSPVDNLNDSNFHYYSYPQPGYQQISLYRKSTKKPLTMYYQQIQTDDRAHGQIQAVADTSTIIDFNFFNVRANEMDEQTIVDRSKMVRQSEWVKKYEPHKFVDLLTDDKVNRNMLTWLKSWDHIVFNKPVVSTAKQTVTPSMFNKNFNSNQNQANKFGDNQTQSVFNNPKKIILLAGPPGCGKTTLMRVLANHCKYQIVQINASDDRSANNLIEKIEQIAGNDTIRTNKKPALICLDQIDGIAESEASGISKVLEFIEKGKKPKKVAENNDEQIKPAKKDNKQKSKTNFSQAKAKIKQAENTKMQKKIQNNTTGSHLNRPVIFICNDPFAKSLKQLRSHAHVVYFSQLNADRIVKRMRQILEKQKIHIEHPVLQKICQICRNDVRSCVGILELVAREKRINNKNPKDLINKMKLSFTKDNQTSINQFLEQLLFKKSRDTISLKQNQIKSMSEEMMVISNPSLLMETFLQNILTLPTLHRKHRPLLRVYEDLVSSDVLMKQSFKYHNQLDRYFVLPYLRFSFSFGNDETRKIQFPSYFFERLRKHKLNKELLQTIYSGLPMQIRLSIHKQCIAGCYLSALYLKMQPGSPKQSDIIDSVSAMLTYGFKFSKHRQQNIYASIFTPEIDFLLTFGQSKPEILLTNVTKSLMEENYEFFKDRKEMLANNELRDNTAAMINQMNLLDRKKKINAHSRGLKYRFVEGTGTKTSYTVTMSYFF